MIKIISSLLMIFMNSFQSESATIESFTFAAQQKFNLRQVGFVSNDTFTSLSMPANSTVSIGPEDIQWAVCGASSNLMANYSPESSETFISIGGFEAGECSVSERQGYDALKSVMSRGDMRH